MGGVYHVVTTSHRRRRFFTDLSVARAVIRTLHQCDQLETLAYALMPDHLHWLIRLGARQLADELHLAKSLSARRVNALLQRRGPVWMPGYYERALRDEEDLRNAARYVVANPLKAGLVASLAQYSHWDAAWLEGGGSPLDP